MQAAEAEPVVASQEETDRLMGALRVRLATRVCGASFDGCCNSGKRRLPHLATHMQCIWCHASHDSHKGTATR